AVSDTQRGQIENYLTNKWLGTSISGATTFSFTNFPTTNVLQVFGSPNPSCVAGANITVTAYPTNTVATNVPTATVQFSTNGVNLGGPVTLTNGVATLVTNIFSSGTNVVTAVYSGDSNYNASTNTYSQVISAGTLPTITCPANLTLGAVSNTCSATNVSL